MSDDLSPELQDEVIGVATAKMISWQAAKKVVLERHLAESARREEKLLRLRGGEPGAVKLTVLTTKEFRDSLAPASTRREPDVRAEALAFVEAAQKELAPVPGPKKQRASSSRMAPAKPVEAPAVSAPSPHVAPSRVVTGLDRPKFTGHQRPFSDEPWGIAVSDARKMGQR